MSRSRKGKRLRMIRKQNRESYSWPVRQKREEVRCGLQGDL